jgi:hypothetical protein
MGGYARCFGAKNMPGPVVFGFTILPRSDIIEK